MKSSSVSALAVTIRVPIFKQRCIIMFIRKSGLPLNSSTNMLNYSVAPMVSVFVIPKICTL